MTAQSKIINKIYSPYGDVLPYFILNGDQYPTVRRLLVSHFNWLGKADDEFQNPYPTKGVRQNQW